MRDVNYGWALRYAHANIASFFFIFVYALIYINYNLFIYISLKIKIKIYYYNYKMKIILNNLIILFLNKNLTSSKKDTLYSELKTNLFDNLKSLINIKDLNKQNQIGLKDNDFLKWFVGFSDAESSFLINIKNNREAHFIFQITLHIDDVITLYTIRDKLGIGVVSISGSTCSYRIHSFKIIVSILLPIFNKYSLLTHKQLDYKDWKKAILIKKENQKENKSLSEESLKNIIDIKNNMNTLRNNYEDYKVSYNMINKFWLIGFIEGDGSFYFSNTSVVLAITQKDNKILEEIAIFIKNIPLAPLYSNLVIPNKPNCIITYSGNAHQLRITDKDVLFQYLWPFLKAIPFYSRKKIDFLIWSIVLFIFILGYNTTKKGKEILLKLSNHMNSKRYFSNIIDILDEKDIFELFNINPPLDIHSGKSHFILNKELSLSKGSRLGYKVYIYKDGLEINGSPFDSYREGGKAIGLNSVSSIKNYIDTGRIFKEGYTFYSKPILK
jgi:LAGLIDADG endonuclease